MGETLRLFLIEDDDDVALLIRKSLERYGHEVTGCRSAADALIVLGQATFDLVLLDQRLPDMSGLELLQRLAGEGVSTPVLMVTGYGDEHLATRVLRAGAMDYIVKDPALTFLGELPKRVSESVRRHRLEKSNRLLIQALESARDGIMITDVQGTILEVNQALETLTGYTRQELIGQTPRLLKSGVHAPEVYANLWRTILNRGSWQGELTNRRKDGSLFSSFLTISPIVDAQGRLTNFVGIQRDITEHKKLEKQLLQAQKMQSVGTLAGGVAHEFNNLLAGINGYAALGLREPDLGPGLREFLQNIVTLSERAAVLTRQLLAFARKPALARQPTCMADLLRETAELVRRTLHLDVQVEIEGPDGGPEAALVAEADANQLQQALVNLALNARDANLARGSVPAGAAERTAGGASSPAVCFRAFGTVLEEARQAFPQQIPSGSYVVLEVEDHGCGMSPEVLSQALDPFFTTKDVGQGTGLGLPMVFGIVQGHQGYLVIDSLPAQGTRVTLYLPRPEKPAPVELEARQPLRPQVLEPEKTAGHSILVIDDEEAVLDVICRFLQIAGHRVTGATSGQQALDLLAGGLAVDLIILDLMMPREDPAVTFQRLKQRRPLVPVLVCTGMPLGDSSLGPLGQQSAGVIRKPFRMNELWYAVKHALDGASGSA
jgi:PAS domain S-box-containing protein